METITESTSPREATVSKSLTAPVLSQSAAASAEHSIFATEPIVSADAPLLRRSPRKKSIASMVDRRTPSALRSSSAPSATPPKRRNAPSAPISSSKTFKGQKPLPSTSSVSPTPKTPKAAPAQRKRTVTKPFIPFRVPRSDSSPSTGKPQPKVVPTHRIEMLQAQIIRASKQGRDVNEMVDRLMEMQTNLNNPNAEIWKTGRQVESQTPPGVPPKITHGKFHITVEQGVGIDTERKTEEEIQDILDEIRVKLVQTKQINVVWTRSQCLLVVEMVIRGRCNEGLVRQELWDWVYDRCQEKGLEKTAVTIHCKWGKLRKIVGFDERYYLGEESEAGNESEKEEDGEREEDDESTVEDKGEREENFDYDDETEDDNV
ncbi:hypothetical protein GQ43DRAFT_436770, partial [Delitschia confertaspora ATCC 74209]